MSETPRDSRGRFTRTTRPPDFIVDTDEHGHLTSVHGPGWRFDTEKRYSVAPLLLVALGLAIGWLIAAIVFDQMLAR